MMEVNWLDRWEAKCGVRPNELFHKHRHLNNVGASVRIHARSIESAKFRSRKNGT